MQKGNNTIQHSKAAAVTEADLNEITEKRSATKRGEKKKLILNLKQSFFQAVVK